MVKGMGSRKVSSPSHQGSSFVSYQERGNKHIAAILPDSDLPAASSATGWAIPEASLREAELQPVQTWLSVTALPSLRFPSTTRGLALPSDQGWPPLTKRHHHRATQGCPTLRELPQGHQGLPKAGTVLGLCSHLPPFIPPSNQHQHPKIYGRISSYPHLQPDHPATPAGVAIRP